MNNDLLDYTIMINFNGPNSTQNPFESELYQDAEKL